MSHELSRRSLLAVLASTPLALKAAYKKIPIGIELYSVRDELQKDDFGTLDHVAKMGYEGVEFYAPYYDWQESHAKDIRKKLDDLGMKCYSTHNGRSNFSKEKIGKAIALNQILGTNFMVMAHPGNVTTLQGWKEIAQLLNEANQVLEKEDLHAGYHNHDLEWKPTDGQMPLALLADSTDKTVMMQFDVGTCLETHNDPIAWIERNPGRIKSLHLKDWSPEKGYKVMFGEGVAPWKEIFAAAENKGGVEYYLIEQEGSQYSEFESADRCLIAYRHLHG